ncbi:hypothetical protein RYX36_028365 [Vicia faba]
MEQKKGDDILCVKYYDRLVNTLLTLCILLCISRIWNESWLTLFFYKPCNYELFVKQFLNMEMDIVIERQSSITTVECQPSGVNGGMLVFVSGNLQLPDKQHALKFSQIIMETKLVVVEPEVKTKEEMASHLSSGSLSRATGSTNMNSQSRWETSGSGVSGGGSHSCGWSAGRHPAVTITPSTLRESSRNDGSGDGSRGGGGGWSARRHPAVTITPSTLRESSRNDGSRGGGGGGWSARRHPAVTMRPSALKATWILDMRKVYKGKLYGISEIDTYLSTMLHQMRKLEVHQVIGQPPFNHPSLPLNVSRLVLTVECLFLLAGISSSPTNNMLLSSVSRIWNKSWLTLFFYKPCNYELFVKQFLNMEMDIVIERQSSITTVECQPSGVNGGMLVFVSGNLQLPDKQHALKFSQIIMETKLVVVEPEVKTKEEMASHLSSGSLSRATGSTNMNSQSRWETSGSGVSGGGSHSCGWSAGRHPAVTITPSTLRESSRNDGSGDGSRGGGGGWSARRHPAVTITPSTLRESSRNDGSRGGGGGGWSARRHPAVTMRPSALKATWILDMRKVYKGKLYGISEIDTYLSTMLHQMRKLEVHQVIGQPPFRSSMQSSITTVECQPSGVNGGMLVFVSGNLQLPDKQHALKFSQEDEATSVNEKKIEENMHGFECFSKIGMVYIWGTDEFRFSD